MFGLLGAVGASGLLALLEILGPARAGFFLSRYRLAPLLPLSGILFGGLSLAACALGVRDLAKIRTGHLPQHVKLRTRVGATFGGLGTLLLGLSIWIGITAGDPLLESISKHNGDLVSALREVADEI